MKPKSVLVIGASGRTGSQVVDQLCHHASKPNVYAFCRDLSKLNDTSKSHCKDVYCGDTRETYKIEQALAQSDADIMIVCLGNGDSTAQTDVRTASAKAIVSTLQKLQYHHVKALVVSSNGAGGSRIKVGPFDGKAGRILEHLFRHVLKDHDGQEALFRTALQDRTVIVRPTSLTDNCPTGKIKQFGDLEKAPSIYTDRLDLAEWIVEEVCGEVRLFGDKIANITSVQ
jgi:nucleoside-diphosphate-sugar epimerase